MTFQKALPQNLYLCRETRELDQLAAEEEGIATIILMKRAGKAAYQKLLELFGETPLVILCGAGNNAGDGYVIAALAAQRNHSVTLYSVSDPEALKGDAALAYRFAQQEKVDIQNFDLNSAATVDRSAVIVDALLGTGFSPPLRENYVSAIEWINSSNRKVFALDLPSGLHGDGGYAALAVKADVTMSFVGLKPGLITGQGPHYVGNLYFDDLSIPPDVYRKVDSHVKRIDLSTVEGLAPMRSASSHKGSHGKVLVCGGDIGTGGAALMAAEAALYSGAGLTSLATHTAHVTPALVRAPEIMTFPVDNISQIEGRGSFACVVVGPGLGQSAWSEQVLYAALQVDAPVVIDADALNLLAKYGLKHFSEKRDNWVLTPHPGEAARLLNCSVDRVQQDRIQAAQRIQHEYGGVVVLKGAGTIVADHEQVSIANVGNAAMAVGGMGDILSGVIGALIGQGLDCHAATKLAVCVHGEAGVRCSEAIGGLIGLRPTELLPVIRQLLN